MWVFQIILINAFSESLNIPACLGKRDVGWESYQLKWELTRNSLRGEIPSLKLSYKLTMYFVCTGWNKNIFYFLHPSFFLTFSFFLTNYFSAVLASFLNFLPSWFLTFSVIFSWLSIISSWFPVFLPFLWHFSFDVFPSLLALILPS